MSTKYRILRDNKERGPLSLEELLELQLKPFDLIWIEGKSAGWRYPSEIDSLKPYLDPQGTQQPVTVLPTQTNSQVHPASQNTRSVTTPSSVISSAPLSASDMDDNNEEELTSEKLERKADEIYQRVQAYAQQQELKQKETQTKYARSLEDLKQDYADWLHKKKHKKNFRLVSIGKPVLLTGAACIILFAAGLVFLKNDKRTPDTGLKPGEKYISNASFEPKEKNKETEVKSDSPSVPPKQEGIIQNKSEQSTGLSVDQFIDSVRNALAKDRKPKTSRQPRKTETVTDPVETTNTIPTLPEPAPPKKEVPTAQQVNMNASYQQDAHKKNISSLEVTIQNNSSEIIKLVTVDIFYYKKGDRLFDKETLYFNNIQAGSSMTLSRPGNRKAITARFQMGQVQAGN